MKRIWFAILFTFISISIGVFELSYIGYNSSAYIKKIDNSKNLIQQGNYYNAEKEINSALEDFEKTAVLFDIFLAHNDVDDISQNLSELTEFAKTENKAEFNSLCEKTKRQLQSLKDSELPLFENIL